MKHDPNRWHIDATGSAYARKPERVPTPAPQANKTWRTVREVLFWGAVALAASGTLAIQSRTGAEPAQRVRVHCETGALLDVLRSGSGTGPACYAERP
jgi:hypothetical protein